MAFALDEGIVIPLIIFFVIAMAVTWIIGKIISSKPKTQPITKDQYQRLVSDVHTSCRLNRIKNTKWINTTGDSVHPPIRHYAKYRGSEADARGPWVAWKVKWWTPKRVGPVTWDLIHNWGGKELWIDCNGFAKDGYFVTPLITKDHCKSSSTVEQYDAAFNYLIQARLGLQSLHDTFEQTSFEVMTAMAHKERRLEDLLQRQEYPVVEESEREMTPEPEG